jgi:hypothetical protein
MGDKHDKWATGLGVKGLAQPDSGAVNPFDVPAVQVEVDKLAMEPLRGLASAAAGNAFTLYISAVDQARGDLKEAEAKAAKEAQMKFEIAVSLALVIATPLTAGAAAALAGTALQATLGLAVASKAEGIVKALGVKDAVPITEAILNAATSDSINRLAKSYSASDAQKIIGESVKSFTKTISVAGHNDVNACALSYLNELKKAATASKNQLDLIVANASNFSQLLQVYNSFKNATSDTYYADLSKQLAAFKQNIAPTIVKRARLKAQGDLEENNPNRLYDGENLVKMDAYGRFRFAKIDFTSARNPLTSPIPIYLFTAWVPPEAEAAAATLNPRVLDPKLIRGHIPDPGYP